MKIKNIWLGFSKKLKIDKMKILYDYKIIIKEYKYIV